MQYYSQIIISRLWDKMNILCNCKNNALSFLLFKLKETALHNSNWNSHLNTFINIKFNNDCCTHELEKSASLQI